MKVAVLGGSGYLANTLRIQKNKKIKLIFFSRKHKNKVNYNSLKDLESKLKNFDCIIHLVGMDKNISYKKKTESINLKKKLTEKICVLVNKYKIKLIYVSSIQIYKNFDKQNVLKSTSRLDTKTTYSKAHYVAETIIRKKIISQPCRFQIIRLANVFGYTKEMNKSGIQKNLINNLCFNAIKKKILILDNPSINRNFIPLTIFNDMIFRLLKTKNLSKKVINFGFKTYNLKEISELISKRCKKLFNFEVKVIFDQYIKKKKFIIKDQRFIYKFKKEIIKKEIDRTLKNFI